MTKYILNSGGAAKYPEKEKLFFKEIIKSLDKNPKILFCFFARIREDWEKEFIESKEKISGLINADIKPIFELAFPDKFVEQIKNNDAVIIRGGDDALLLHWLRQFDLPSIWKDKVVAGSSAGSDALVKHFWTCDWRQCFDGLGILPIKFIPHFKSNYGYNDHRGPIDWDKAYEELAKYGDETLPINALAEGDFIVIEK
jgi:peptidase E